MVAILMVYMCIHTTNGCMCTLLAGVHQSETNMKIIMKSEFLQCFLCFIIIFFLLILFSLYRSRCSLLLKLCCLHVFMYNEELNSGQCNFYIYILTFRHIIMLCTMCCRCVCSTIKHLSFQHVAFNYDKTE